MLLEVSLPPHFEIEYKRCLYLQTIRCRDVSTGPSGSTFDQNMDENSCEIILKQTKQVVRLSFLSVLFSSLPVTFVAIHTRVSVC